MEPSLKLSGNGSSSEYDGAREKNDAHHQTYDPGDRHLGSYEKTYDTRHEPHKQSGEKIDHRIAVFVYQRQDEVRRDRRRQGSRQHQIDRDLHETEEVCGDTPHHDRYKYHHGHLARRTGTGLKLTHYPKFESYKPHGQEQTPMQIRKARKAELDHEIETDSDDQQTPDGKQLHLVKE